MFVHRSGKVSCGEGPLSFWGCKPNNIVLMAVLTDHNNKIVAPAASEVNSSGRYSLAGFTSSSSALVFCAHKKPHCVLSGTELSLWYGEDIRGFTEHNNSGKTCADVHAMLY